MGSKRDTGAGTIRTGIGGWTYEPWRGVFYPAGLRQADELAYAASRLGTIEINATFYRLHKPAHFAAWRKAAPPGFVFALKGSRFVTNRKVLAEAGAGLAKFLGQGLEELGDMLGPINWQLAPTKRFDAGDLAAFLDLLPAELDGLPLRHALEVRHASFACAQFVTLARERGIAIVTADHEHHPQIADQTAPFTYARLMRSDESIATGYDQGALERWARIACAWHAGEAPADLAYAAPPQPPPGGAGREVFLYAINGAKIRAPAAAMALAELV